MFREEVEGNDNSKFLWGNPAYALATRMTEAFFRSPLVRLDSRRQGWRPRRRSADTHVHHRPG